MKKQISYLLLCATLLGQISINASALTNESNDEILNNQVGIQQNTILEETIKQLTNDNEYTTEENNTNQEEITNENDINKDDVNVNDEINYEEKENESNSNLAPSVLEENNSLDTNLHENSIIRANTNLSYSFDKSTGTIHFTGGSVDGEALISVFSSAGIEVSDIKHIVFDGKVDVEGGSSKWMFSGLSELISIEGFENLNLSSVTDMSGMFNKCSSLSSLDLSTFNTSSVTDMSWMFSFCSSLSSLDLSTFNTSSVTDMDGMFSVCSSLSNLDLSTFDTSNVTTMKSMFYGSSSLSSLDLSTFDTSNVTTMKSMFYGSSSLSSLDLSTFNTSNVTGMDYMFNKCISLSNLDLSTFNTSNVTSMIGMLKGCTSLKKLVLGLNFQFKDGSSGLRSAKLPNILNNEQYTGKWQNIGAGTETNPLGSNVWTSDNLLDNYNGELDADTYVWQPKLISGENVTVKYLDDGGKAIPDIPDVILSGNVGENYNSVQKEISGYTFKEVQGNATGTFTDQEQEVRYIYTKNPVPGENVTVKYLDDDGKAIPDIPDVILSGNVGENYNSVQKEISGYTFKEVQGNTTGTFTNQLQTVTYIYTKNQVIEDLSHVLVHDSSLKIGDKWLPQDNFDEATNFEGKIEEFSDIIVDGTVDTTKAGTYEVTYTIPEEHLKKSSLLEGNHSATAKIIVTEEKAKNDTSDADSNELGHSTDSSNKLITTNNKVSLANKQDTQNDANNIYKVLPETGSSTSVFTFVAGVAVLVFGIIFAIIRLKKNK